MNSQLVKYSHDKRQCVLGGGQTYRQENASYEITNVIYRVFIKYCVFFPQDCRIYRTLVFLCFPLVSVYVHTPGMLNTSAAAELAESEKFQNVKEKTQQLMNTLYHTAVTKCYAGRK